MDCQYGGCCIAGGSTYACIRHTKYQPLMLLLRFSYSQCTPLIKEKQLWGSKSAFNVLKCTLNILYVLGSPSWGRCTYCTQSLNFGSTACICIIALYILDVSVHVALHAHTMCLCAATAKTLNVPKPSYSLRMSHYLCILNEQAGEFFMYFNKECMHTAQLPASRWIGGLSSLLQRWKLHQSAPYSWHKPHCEILIKVSSFSVTKRETMNMDASEMETRDF